MGAVKENTLQPAEMMGTWLEKVFRFTLKKGYRRLEEGVRDTLKTYFL